MDIEVYESIVRKYTLTLYRYCGYRLSFNQQLVEEAVNDVLRILFIKWDTLEINDSIISYLYRVADNCIKQAKDRDCKYYSVHSSFEEAMDEGKICEPAYFDDYFHDIDEDELFIQKVVESLPEDYRRIFKYRYIDKKTIVEIVELTGIPYLSVRLRLMKIEECVRSQVENNY